MKDTYLTIEQTAFEEIVALAQKGFTIEVTKATDGTPIVLAQKNGHTRLFTIGV